MVEIKTGLDGTGLTIGIVRCRFNEPIGRVALEACLGRLGELGVAGSDIAVVAVAGALEDLSLRGGRDRVGVGPDAGPAR